MYMYLVAQFSDCEPVAIMVADECSLGSENDNDIQLHLASHSQCIHRYNVYMYMYVCKLCSYYYYNMVHVSLLIYGYNYTELIKG